MIHVATAEDVTVAMQDGWLLRGFKTPGKRAYVYWLRPADGPFAAKRVSPSLIAKLTKSGQIYGAQNAYGDLIFQLGTQEVLSLGA